jgi:hypothetical protein
VNSDESLREGSLGRRSAGPGIQPLHTCGRCTKRCGGGRSHPRRYGWLCPACSQHLKAAAAERQRLALAAPSVAAVAGVPGVAG